MCNLTYAHTHRVRPDDAYGQVLEGRLPTEERRKLIKRFTPCVHKFPLCIPLLTDLLTD